MQGLLQHSTPGWRCTVPPCLAQQCAGLAMGGSFRLRPRSLLPTFPASSCPPPAHLLPSSCPPPALLLPTSCGPHPGACPPAGLCLAERAGLRQADVIEVVKLGAIACPMFALKVGEAAQYSTARQKAEAVDALLLLLLLVRCCCSVLLLPLEAPAATCICLLTCCLPACRAPACRRAPTRPPSRSSTNRKT